MDPSAEDLFGDFVARSIRNSQGLHQYLTGKYSEYQAMRDDENILSMRALYDVCTRFRTEDLSEMRISPTDTEKAQILALQEQIN